MHSVLQSHVQTYQYGRTAGMQLDAGGCVCAYAYSCMLMCKNSDAPVAPILEVYIVHGGPAYNCQTPVPWYNYVVHHTVYMVQGVYSCNTNM